VGARSAPGGSAGRSVGISSAYRARLTSANGSSNSQRARLADPDVNRPQWKPSTTRGRPPRRAATTGSARRKMRPLSSPATCRGRGSSSILGGGVLLTP
jgi:hypothetical protein